MLELEFSAFRVSRFLTGVHLREIDLDAIDWESDAVIESVIRDCH